MEHQDIRDLLEEEIRAEIQGLAKLNPGEKAHSDAVDSVAKIYKLRIEELASEREFMRKSDETTNQEIELRFKEAQLREQTKDRYARLGADLARVVLPLLFYAAFINKGYKFEETGVVTSQTLRGLLSKFKPN